MPLLRVLFAGLFLASTVAAAELQTLTGQKISGEIVSIDANQIVIKTATGNVPTPLKQVLVLDLLNPLAPTANSKYTDVELIDGTLIHCEDVKIKGKSVILTRYGVPDGPNKVLTIPMSSVFYIARDAHDPNVKKDWQAFLAKRGKRDILVVKKEGQFDGLEGTAEQGDETGEIISFEMATGKKSNIKLSRLSGLVFNQVQQGEIAETLCRVTDTYRNVYTAREVALKGETVELTTVSGLTITFPKTQFIAKIDYSRDKITFLSDIEPVEVKTAPKEDFGPTLAKDTNLYGDDPIKMNNIAYAKGLSIHAPTTLTYQLNGEYKEFKAVIGIDDSVVADSQVKLVIEGDGRPIYQADLRRKDVPKPININIKDVKFMRIIVDTPGVPLHSQMNLADARINK